jgi:hypothetical protein
MPTEPKGNKRTSGKIGMGEMQSLLTELRSSVARLAKRQMHPSFDKEFPGMLHQGLAVVPILPD